MNNETSLNRKHFVKYSIVSFITFFLLSFLIFFLIEQELRTGNFEELKKEEERVVELEHDFIGQEFSMLLADLHYLHHGFQSDLFDVNNYSKIATNWAVFSTYRRIYDQIRFVNAKGDEKIRINFESDRGYIVPEKDLQNKSDRYYFTETIKLEEESVYISPLDLNIDNYEIEVPYKPVIRISTPLYDKDENLLGIIILNFKADTMLSEFRELAKNSQGDIILLNAAGYSLSSDNSDNDWNFMFEEKKENTFEKEYTKEWFSIQNNEEQFTTENGLITVSQVVLRHRYNIDEDHMKDKRIRLGDNNWYIVSIVKRTQENKSYFDDNIWAISVDILSKNALYFLIITIASIIISFLLYKNRKTYSKIKFYSEFDALTNALNRRAGIEKLKALCPINERRRFLVSLCYVDVNGLKQVNDTLGHKFGDELIKSVAAIIKEMIREKDFLIRLGGDEFLIVFNGIDSEIAESIWQRIVLTYTHMNQDSNRPYIISVSHGIVAFDNERKMDIDELINEADEKMYNEKQVIKKSLNVIKLKP